MVPVSRSGIVSALASIASCVGFALAAPAAQASDPKSAPAAVATDRAWTRIDFDRELLASHGLEIAPDVARLELEAAAPSSFVVDAAGNDFEGISSGRLRHLGGFVLRSRGAAVPMVGFEILPGADPLTLDVLDHRGRKLYRGDQMHFTYDGASGRLRLENVDFRLTGQLAAALGRPELAGLSIGRLTLEATTVALRASSPEGMLDCSPPVWTGTIDVDLTSLSSVQQEARSDGKVAVSVSTGLHNAGTADVPWRRKFKGSFDPYGNDQHPYLIWAIYRIAPVGESGTTTIEALGQSALKHAFFSTNTGCHCSGGQILWAGTGIGGHDDVGCADVYANNNNDDPNALGPRDELEAHSGIWENFGSFFDLSDGEADGVCDEGGPQGDDCDDITFADDFDRRLAVFESDFSTAGATYYADSWYLIRDDVNVFNTMGWRRITPAFGGSSWTFGFQTSLALGSVLDAWVPRTTPPAGASHERVDTGVGELSLAAKTTDLGGGQWHYEYALHNHDFDRKVQSFRVPLPEGATASNAAFRGVATGTGADWTISIEADAVVFQAPADVAVNALDWGTLFSFGFDADAAPAAGSVDLGALEETPELDFTSPAQTPGGALGSAIFFDDFESNGTARWSATEL